MSKKRDRKKPTCRRIFGTPKEVFIIGTLGGELVYLSKEEIEKLKKTWEKHNV